VVPAATLAHLDDIDPEFPCGAREVIEAERIDGRPRHVTELIAEDIGDVDEGIGVAPTDRAGIRRGDTVESRRLEQIGVGVAGIEAIEGLSPGEGGEQGPALQRVVDDPAWGGGVIHRLRRLDHRLAGSRTRLLAMDPDAPGDRGAHFDHSPTVRAPRAEGRVAQPPTPRYSRYDISIRYITLM